MKILKLSTDWAKADVFSTKMVWLLVVSKLMILFLSSPNWRAIGITIGLLTLFLMAVDSNTDAHNTIYHEQLKSLNDESGRP